MHRGQLQHVIHEIGRRFDPSDVDVIPPNDDERPSDRISLVLGEASEFDLEHGYYAQGVTSKKPRFAPANSIARAVPVRVEKYKAWRMEAHDLVLSKLGADREKALDFAKGAATLGLLGRPSFTSAETSRIGKRRPLST